MADTPEPEGKSQFGFLTRKVGPLPIWGWALIAAGLYYWYTHYGPGASASQGNSGTITETVKTSHTGGTSLVSVPSVTGADVEQATQTLHSEGLKASGPAGQKGVIHKVTGENPAAGTEVPRGSTVSLAYKSIKEMPKTGKPRAKNSVKPASGVIGPPGQKGPAPKPGPAPEPVPVPVPPAQGGRWQTEDTLTMPADMQTQPGTQDTQGNSVMDVIPHRPLGM